MGINPELRNEPAKVELRSIPNPFPIPKKFPRTENGLKTRMNAGSSRPKQADSLIPSNTPFTHQKNGKKKG